REIDNLPLASIAPIDRERERIELARSIDVSADGCGLVLVDRVAGQSGERGRDITYGHIHRSGSAGSKWIADEHVDGDSIGRTSAGVVRELALIESTRLRTALVFPVAVTVERVAQGIVVVILRVGRGD